MAYLKYLSSFITFYDKINIYMKEILTIFKDKQEP